MALVGLVGFAVYLSPKISYGLTVSLVGDQIYIVDAGGPYVVYNRDTGESFGGGGSHDANEFVGIAGGPGNYAIIETTGDGVCEDAGYTYQQCRSSGYFVDEARFVVGSSGGAVSVGGGGSSAVVRGNTTPNVFITEPSWPTHTIKGTVTIKYRAYDQDSSGSQSGSFGLNDRPVSLWYLIGQDLDDKRLIAQDLPVEGSYDWDVSGLQEGVVYILAEAKDRADYVGSALSSRFLIDNSAPIFKLTFDPEATKGEAVKITVEASEEISGRPELFVRQTGGQSVKVDLKPDLNNIFIGTYIPILGYDGLASVSIKGQDVNGNVGTTISAGAFFSVGVEPPPRPVITSPLDNELVATNTVKVVGGNARNDLKLSLVVNNKDTYNTVPKSDGSFEFDNVILDKGFNKGVNFMSLLAKDPVGNQTEVALSVKFNLNPTVSFVSPKAKQIFNGTSSLQVAGSDENGDVLKYSFDVSRSGSGVFSSVAKNLTTGTHVFDSGLLADGDYVARVTVDDGSSKVTATSSVFSIRNYLPIISFIDGNKQIINTKNTVLKGKVESPEVPTGDPSNPTLRKFAITKVEYSLDNGANWQLINIGGGEVFNINIKTDEEKSYSVLMRALDERGLYGRAEALVIADFGPPKDAIIESPVNNTIFTKADDRNKKMAGTQVDLIGRAEPESTVTAVANGLEVSVEVGKDGRFVLPDVSLTKHGVNNVAVIVTDIAGNKSPGQTLTLQSNNAPTVRFIQPRTGRGLGGSTKIVWETRDQDLDKVKTTALKIRKVGTGAFTTIVDDPMTEEYVWQMPDHLTTGRYELVVEVSDGVSRAEALVEIVIDKVPPIIESFNLNQSLFTRSAALRGNGVARDDLSGIEFAEYSLAGDVWQAADIASGFLSPRANFIFAYQAGLIDGEYEVKARVKDGAGNVSEPAIVKILVDTTAPRIGSFAFKQAGQILLPNKNGDFAVAAGGDLELTVSLEDDTKTATATIGSIVLPLVREQNNLWSTKVTLSEAGDYSIVIQAVDQLDHESEPKQVGQMKVMPSGKVWYLNDDQQVLSIDGAKIEVWVFDSAANELRFWQAESFGAKNPIATNDAGQYILNLPTGTYELRIIKDGFERLKTDLFTIDRPTLINEDFKMVKRSGIGGWLKGLID